jgi:hypothetical protein
MDYPVSLRVAGRNQAVFKRAGGLRPYPGRKVELIPGHGLHFATPHAGEEEDANDVRCHLVIVLSERIEQRVLFFSKAVGAGHILRFLSSAVSALCPSD